MGINIWATLLGAIVSFFFGGFWYSSKVFGALWGHEEGGMKKSNKGHSKQVYVVSAIHYLLSALMFAFLLGPSPSLEKAVSWGIIVGALFVGTSFGLNYQFANRSVKLWLIDAGYHTCQFVIYGLILGLWH